MRLTRRAQYDAHYDQECWPRHAGAAGGGGGGPHSDHGGRDDGRQGRPQVDQGVQDQVRLRNGSIYVVRSWTLP